MYPRTNYEMTQADLDTILDACKPTPVMLIGGYAGSSPQANANAAWETLGKKMGFDHMTVAPIPGQHHRFFSAVPTENESARADRLGREAEAERQREVSRLTTEIVAMQERLAALTTAGGAD